MMTTASPPTASPPAEPRTRVSRSRPPGWRGGERLRRGLLAVTAVLVLCALWELYKAIGPATGGRLLGVPVLPRANDIAMPHTWAILDELGKQEVRTAGSDTVGASVLKAMWFTIKISLVGLVTGIVVGVLLAVAMARLKIVERGLLPYVVISQTVPLIALAPLVAGWGGKLHLGGLEWQRWMSVSLIAAYLAFFPVAVGMLRGLQSPGANALELMRSYAASWWQTFLRLRLPTSVPFLLPALRLAAASAVIGAIVAEISTGTRGGIGRLIVDYSQSASSNSSRLYDAVLGAAVVGLIFAGLVSLLEVALTWRRGRGAAPGGTTQKAGS
ncbi:ABC transporter permease subunit [Frankia sp. CNm7]|uniref:ABC transporter permease subunit n=1 Tax=Frankia nepalensis TaxID=1836974 RepID=A0A937UWK5_9ACTN|nr:ABC transporter permease subunit [Frankia nepalensis]MBL7497243.1 ABC transporter permease subunit [Frankia nepalensis]MBL7512945.1 ABC transporter permease subunit [Frankia nepalensis]MBL7522625.1 ABC transporter permease subunit [Frankia nepalensis]MBL7633496.1 ABC transporter permease subunit [Frankia nepalensis]